MKSTVNTMQTADNTENKPIVKPKHPGGRPSKYNPELIRKAHDYIENYLSLGHKIPTLAGLSLSIGINKETTQAWSKDKNKREFSVLCQRIKMLQECALIDNGLDSTWNGSITKLLLQKHGYTDNPQANQGPGGIQVTVNRGKVVIESGGQKLAISADDSPSQGVTLDHDPE